MPRTRCMAVLKYGGLVTLCFAGFWCEAFLRPPVCPVCHETGHALQARDGHAARKHGVTPKPRSLWDRVTGAGQFHCPNEHYWELR